MVDSAWMGSSVVDSAWMGSSVVGSASMGSSVSSARGSCVACSGRPATSAR